MQWNGNSQSSQEEEGAAELDNMIVTRKEIHLKQGIDIANIFWYQSPKVPEGIEGKTDQVALVVTEDRRKTPLSSIWPTSFLH